MKPADLLVSAGGRPQLVTAFVCRRCASSSNKQQSGWHAFQPSSLQYRSVHGNGVAYIQQHKGREASAHIDDGHKLDKIPGAPDWLDDLGQQKHAHHVEQELQKRGQKQSAS